MHFRKRKWLPFGETRIIRGDKNNRKEAAVNDSTAAYRLREQLKKFVGIVFPHVPKPQKEFLGQMFFGIQAGQTTVLSRIARELGEDILLKKTEERLSRHLLAEGLDATMQDAVLANHVKRVSKRMFEVPEFFFYAIADGVCRLFSRHGRWNGLDGPDEPEGPCQMELAL